MGAAGTCLVRGQERRGLAHRLYRQVQKSRPGTRNPEQCADDRLRG
jgi:hypothetical protein